MRITPDAKPLLLKVTVIRVRPRQFPPPARQPPIRGALSNPTINQGNVLIDGLVALK